MTTASAAAPATLSSSQILDIATEAYVYLYSLITMEITRRQMSNVENGASKPMHAPMNMFLHMRAFPPADMKVVVRPNFDTLYSSAWVDLTAEPMVITVPDTAGRFYLLPMLDMWTDVFAVPGKRTTGTGAARFLLAGPGWQGQVPEGLERIDAPTPYVWIIGRTQTNGVADYAAVHAVQDGFTMKPLSRLNLDPIEVTGKVDPDVDMVTPPLDQVNNMDPAAYFQLGADLMALHPPHITDQPIVARMRRIGVEAGKPVKVAADVLKQAAAHGLQRMRDFLPHLARVVDGWQMNTDTMGVYGTFYLKRALVAMVGLGANLVEDAVYPLNLADSDGQPLDGSHSYVLHFDNGKVPPVDAFWSVTLYDSDGFQVANELNRFAIGDRDALKFNADGSLDLYISAGSPGADKVSNWLPAPKGAFNLCMRLYAPRAAALTGAWTPPAVKKAN